MLLHTYRAREQQVSHAKVEPLFATDERRDGLQRWRWSFPRDFGEFPHHSFSRSVTHSLSELSTCVPVIELKSQKMNSQFTGHGLVCSCAVPARDNKIPDSLSALTISSPLNRTLEAHGTLSAQLQYTTTKKAVTRKLSRALIPPTLQAYGAEELSKTATIRSLRACEGH